MAQAFRRAYQHIRTRCHKSSQCWWLLEISQKPMFEQSTRYYRWDWTDPCLESPQKGRQDFPKPAGEGGSVPWRILKDAYLIPYVKHSSDLVCSQKSTESPRNAFPASKAFKWLQDSHTHRAQTAVNHCSTQWPLTEWVNAHILMGKSSRGHTPCHCLHLYPLWILTELNTKATHAAPYV